MVKRVKLVTGYVPLQTPHRSIAQYKKLGERLKKVPVPMQVFDDYKLSDCWMAKFLRRRDISELLLRPCVGDNPGKNSTDYHVVQHQKTAWLNYAHTLDPNVDVYVWVDYGVFALPGVTVEVIKNFCDAVSEDEITIPGCWWDNSPHWNNEIVNWRFCGTVLACPNKFVPELDYQVREIARRDILKTSIITWEVNTWAKVEREVPALPIKWVKADHNHTLFTGVSS